MTSETQVVEDGVDRDPRPPRPPSSWLVLVLGYGLGLGMGAVFFGAPDTEPLPTGPSAEMNAPPVTETTAETPPQLGITETIAGFNDALVAVASTQTDSLNHLLWPREGPLVERPMFGGDDPKFDSDNQYIALTQELPSVDGLVLSVGRFHSIEPLATGVTSFAWHDADSGHISYTTEADGEWQLWKVAPNRITELVAAGASNDSEVVTWGEWGWAIQTPDDQLLLLTPGGEFKDVHPGRIYASMPTGWILVAGETVQLVSAGGGVRGVNLPPETVGELRDAAFSTSGHQVALRGELRTVIVSVDNPLQEPNNILDERFTGPLTWSSDDRFLLGPTSRGVLVYDLETGTHSVVLIDHRVLAVAVRPGRSS